MGYQVLDNFLPEKQFKDIQHFLLEDGLCPWYYNSFILNDKKDDYVFQFTHTFIRGSDQYFSPNVAVIDPLIEAIKPSVIFKIKANLGGRTPFMKKAVTTQTFLLIVKLRSITLTQIMGILYLEMVQKLIA